MEYLKSKVARAGSSSSSGEESEDEAVNCDEGSEDEEEDPCAAPAQRDRDRTGPGPEQGTPSGNKKPQEARAEVRVDRGTGAPGEGQRRRAAGPARVPGRPEAWLPSGGRCRRALAPSALRLVAVWADVSTRSAAAKLTEHSLSAGYSIRPTIVLGSHGSHAGRYP